MVQMSDGDFTLPKKASVCDVCHKDPARYRCPRCASRSCSVMCSKKHKEDDNCSGVRDTSSFAPTRRVSDFSGNIIASDEKFLGNVKSSVIERIGAVKPPSSSCLRSLSNQTDYEVDNSWLLRTTESVQDKNQEGKKPLQLDAHMLPDDISTKETECSKEVSATRDRVEGDALSCVHHQLTLAQRYLLSNAHRRRIWLTIIPSGIV
ncbi:hypothetical protein AB6A40_009992 [Gnathostoma spinigerum]|uniref:Box C/D snoRNA protein 1 n=1 Tax=Gnathostoma spinigerum TaxID=75299 RepID=A0ABD6ETZ4_9BILA